MINLNISVDTQLVRCSGPVAAGTTDINGAEIDMQGWESVRAVALIGALTATAVTSLKAQQSSVSGSGYADLEGTSVVIADDQGNKYAYLDLIKPEKRYIRFVVVRGTANAVLEGLMAELYDKKGLTPDNQNANTIATSKVVLSPEEGTP